MTKRRREKAPRLCAMTMDRAMHASNLRSRTNRIGPFNCLKHCLSDVLHMQRVSGEGNTRTETRLKKLLRTRMPTKHIIRKMKKYLQDRRVPSAACSRQHLAGVVQTGTGTTGQEGAVSHPGPW